jgi:carboxymethylenebutenolidase
VIKTDSDRPAGGEVTDPVGDFKMPAYRAAPAGKAGAPVVLVISEIFGVHEHIADVARRFAKAGYFAIAPELFVRQGDAAAYGEDRQADRRGDAKTPDAQVMGDLDACVAWAKAQGADSSRLGITGFCWGGRTPGCTPRTTRREGRRGLVRAGGARLPCRRQDRPGPCRRIKAPVLGLYGAADGGIPNDTVEKMRDSLVAAGNVRSEIVLLPRHAARLPRRLPPELPQGAGRGRLEALPGLVARERGGLTRCPAPACSAGRGFSAPPAPARCCASAPSASRCPAAGR